MQLRKVASLPKVLFFGTPEFSARTLRYLLDHEVPVVGVVTRPSKARSRRTVRSAVAELAKERAIPLFTPERSSDIVKELAELGAEVSVVVVYGELLRKSVLELAPLGCVNVHPSLLPAYRGPAPVQQALIDGVTHTGVTIMGLVKEMDAGPIFRQVEVDVPVDMNLLELDDILCDLGCVALLKTLEDLKAGRAEPREQDHEQATFTSKIHAEDCQIDWSRPAEEIHNLVRGAISRPGAWCWVELDGRRFRLKVHRTRLGSEKGWIKNGLELVEVQLEGKRPVSGEEFLRGHSFAKL